MKHFKSRGCKKGTIVYLTGSKGFTSNHRSFINFFNHIGFDVYSYDHLSHFKWMYGTTFPYSSTIHTANTKHMKMLYAFLRNFRKWECEMMIKKLDIPVILVGNSEGAIGVSRSKTFGLVQKKIILGYSIDHNYFTPGSKNIKCDVPVYHIIGYDDEYFGKTRDSVASRLARRRTPQISKCKEYESHLLYFATHDLSRNKLVYSILKSILNE